MEKKPSKKVLQQISDDKILSLYHQGYSASIISKTYKINPAYISKVLKHSGLKPRDYKSCPDFIKRVLRELLLAGFTYSEISKKTNVAYNYIREYVSRSDEIRERSQELFRRKSNNTIPPTVPPSSVCSFSMIEKFRVDYTNGFLGFCALMLNLDVNEEQIIYLFSIIDDDMLQQHNEKLKSVILSKHAAGIPALGISKKLGISPSFIINVIKNHKI